MKINASSRLLTLALIAVSVSGCSIQQNAFSAEKNAPVVNASAAVGKTPPPAKDATKEDSLSRQTNLSDDLIAPISKPPENGFGCYFTPPEDIEKSGDKRRYLVIINDDGSGLMNIGGDDRRLTRQKAERSDAPQKKKAVWFFSAGDFKITLNLTVTGTSNDGENTHFDATVKVSKDGREQTVAAKGFCGG